MNIVYGDAMAHEAKSRENVATMRKALEALDRRDRAAWLALRPEDCEVVTIDAWPEAGAIHGREAAWDFYIQVLDTFDDLTTSEAEVVTAAADELLLHQRHQVRGKASGAGVEMNYWVVVTFRDGKMARDRWFTDRDQALDAMDAGT